MRRELAALAGAVLAVMCLGQAAPPSAAARDLAIEHVIVNTTMGLAESELVIPSGDLTPGASLRTTISIHGEAITLDLEPHSVRAESYKVFSSDADGRLSEVEPGPVNTLRGVVRGDARSFVAVSILDGALYGRIDFGNGHSCWLEPVPRHLGVRHGLHVVYHSDDVLPDGGACATDAFAREVGRLALPTNPGGPSSGGQLSLAELAIDADFSYGLRWADNTEARINAIINQMNVQYERDVLIEHAIVALIVREEQVYTADDCLELLEQFRDEWIKNHQDIDRDVAHLFVGRGLGALGCAWPAVICDNVTDGYGYSLVQSDFNNIFSCATDLSAHQLGHNWAAEHCNCTGWTMNASVTCANRFIQRSINSIVAHRDSRECLGPDCPADIDASGDVGFNDLLLVLAAWGNEGGPEDLDGNGVVNFDDLLLLLAAWGPCE